MSPLSLYRQQAEIQIAAAVATNLPQVRDRCMRAASAWTELADRAQKNEDARGLKAAQERAFDDQDDTFTS